MHHIGELRQRPCKPYTLILIADYDKGSKGYRLKIFNQIAGSEQRGERRFSGTKRPLRDNSFKGLVCVGLIL